MDRDEEDDVARVRQLLDLLEDAIEKLGGEGS